MMSPNPQLNLNRYLILFISILLSQFITAQQLAFPGAEGAGALATGGRGGAVLHVTNLDWNNQPGSLKWALEQQYARTIVFDVSGTIDASGPNYYYILNGVNYANLTIAGQTAPEGGITIEHNWFNIQYVPNVILRYIRFVHVGYFNQGSNGSINALALNFNPSGYGVLDHVSTRYSFNSGGLGVRSDNQGQIGVTVQNSLFGDSKTGMLVGENPAVEAYVVNGADFSVHHNLFAHISHRFPSMSGNGNYEVINNVAYNPSQRLALSFGTPDINYIGNYARSGDKTLAGVNKIGTYVGLYETGIKPHSQWYTDGNIIEGTGYTKTDTDWGYTNVFPNGDIMVKWGGASNQTNEFADPALYRSLTKFPDINPNAPVTIQDVEDAYLSVVADVGANKYLNADGTFGTYLDSVDQAYIDETIARTGTYRNVTDINDVVYPVLPNNSRPANFYVSNPHIPEVWFQANVPTGQDHNDIAPSGYTWLEEYLNGVDIDVNAIGVESVVVSPNTAEIQIPETVTLTETISPDNATNQTGVWTSSDESIATVDSNGLVTPVSEGVVTITFTTNDGGFTDTSEITVLPEALQASAGDDQQICEGESITLTATANRGTNYVWNTGETTAIIEVTPSVTTTYTVTVSDDTGQSDDASVTVTVNTLPVAEAGEDQTICEGESITLTATGGTSYLWSNGETTESIEVSPILESTYSVEVFSNNCSSTDSVTVFVNEAPDISVTDDSVIVDGESITLTANGGDNYEWNTGEITQSITVTPTITSTYTVTSLGVNGCSTSIEVIVTVIPEIVAEAGEDVTICSGESVTLGASGGVTYVWDTGDSGSELTVSPTVTTTYTVTAEDVYGYTDTDIVTIFVNEIPDILVDENVYVMIGNSVTLTASGGNTYSWSTGETTASISVSPDVTTTYTVTGFSVNGCQSTAEVLVTVVEELSANAGVDVSICIGESITLNASGGITFTWNTGDTIASPTFSPTETTTYTVTVTDGFGNSDSDDVTVTVNSLPVAYAGEDQTVCEGEPAILTAEGGDSYLWSTGQTTATITVNPNTDTIYTVEVFSNNCSDIDDITVFTLDAPQITISEDVVIITGNSTTLTASGGDTYLWNTGETTASISVNPTETTTYTVTSFSSNGCQSSTQVIVTVIPEVVANAGNDVVICNGESVTLNASGGETYAWNTGDTNSSPTFSPTATTTYTVTATDNYGNSDSDSVTVTVNELPNVIVSENITIIEGESTNLVVDGAESYLWNTGETSNSITVNPTETTTYIVTGTTDSCSVETEVTVTVEVLFQASAGEDKQVCENDTYEIVLTANQGDSYLWNTGDTTQSIVVSPLSTSTYTVTVTYGTQEDVDDVTVYVNPNPNVVIANGDSVDIMDGDFVTLSATGANSYEWNNGATQPNIAVSPSITTTYEVKGYIGDCYDEKQVTVNVIPEVVADAGDDVTICLDEVATLTASGGEDYVWSTGETTQTIQVSPTEITEYTVTVFNTLDFDEDSVVVDVDTDCEDIVEVPIDGESQGFTFEVYPNPASSIINVKLSGSNILTNIYLYDITGKVIHQARIVNDDLSSSSTTKIDVSSLQPGMYFIKLFDVDRGELSKKVIVN